MSRGFYGLRVTLLMGVFLALLREPEQLAFAYLIGNGDAHAKNFSVLHGVGGEWRMSPVYDVPSSYPYGDTTMALSIGGRSGGDFGATSFVELGERPGVPAGRAARAGRPHRTGGSLAI